MLTPCHCGRFPTTRPDGIWQPRTVEVQYTCSNCYDPSDNDLRGYGATEREAGLSWTENMAEWVDAQRSASLRLIVANCDARVDAGTARAGDRALACLLRDELTRRHQECRDTWPPPPSVPREERETVRPVRA